MIPLDNFERWLPLIEESARNYLSQEEFDEFCLYSQDEIDGQLKALLEKPIANFTLVNEVYFRARWAEVLKILNQGNNLKLLEVASGDADMIPQAMARTHPCSHYITANMNKMLNESLLYKTKTLPIRLEIIEDDAANIVKHLGEETVDLIAFQHAVNDVIQAMLCEREGIDTVYSDWMKVLPQMIDVIKKEVSQNTLEQHVKIPFLELIKTLLKTMKKNGTIVINHYMFQYDLDLGYPPDLFEQFIPITREWIKELKDCKEIFFDGFDANWWIFLQKI